MHSPIVTQLTDIEIGLAIANLENATWENSSSVSVLDSNESWVTLSCFNNFLKLTGRLQDGLLKEIGLEIAYKDMYRKSIPQLIDKDSHLFMLLTAKSSNGVGNFKETVNPESIHYRPLAMLFESNLDRLAWSFKLKFPECTGNRYGELEPF